ncbi:16S rRNA (cytidine(1402)-2'-O)-methyltransferase [Ectothiorhodospiraceae bacterium WFHF3C12]|nr:16S rRNA (cytidine(1402)-2'-O)-methyltransferase [Ectothiorhodospiraceae bacterium WFHF3C12]
MAATLYVVATPIGNLEDMTYRAVRILREVDLVAVEDTRHARKLLEHYGIDRPLLSLHEHNEAQRLEPVLSRLEGGASIAVISDAGTPLISDPGFQLVREARRRGIAVSPVPGASAITAALSVAGLPTDRFVYEGFLPAKPAARRRRLEQLVTEPRTLVLLESSHRIRQALADLVGVFGEAREAVLARELTKRFETLANAGLGELEDWLRTDPNQCKGEFVILVGGAPASERRADEAEVDRILALLVASLPVKQAAALASGITGEPRNRLYKRALELADTP